MMMRMRMMMMMTMMIMTIKMRSKAITNQSLITQKDKIIIKTN